MSKEKKLPKEFLNDAYSTTPEFIYTNIPRPVEEENPNGEVKYGEVKTYFLPELFTWVKKCRNQGTRQQISMKKKMLVIYEGAARLYDLKPGDYVFVGINKGNIAIRKSATGLMCIGNSTDDKKSYKEGKKEYISLNITSAAELNKRLKEFGWPETFTIEVSLQGDMLVGKKPDSGEVVRNENGQGQAHPHPWRSKKTMSKDDFRAKILEDKNKKRVITT